MKKALALLVITALSVLAQIPKPSGSGGGSGGGSGTVSGTTGAVACFDGITSVGDCTAGTGIAIAGGEISADRAVLPFKAAAAGTPTMEGQLTGDFAVDTSASPIRLHFCAADDGTDCSSVIRLVGYAEMLPLAGGTLTGQLITDNLGIEFEESDTNPACAAGNFNIYADASENKLKACQNGTASDLIGGGSSTTYYGNFHTGARGASSTNLPCCGWATTVTSGAGFASAVSSADYSRTVMTFADAASTSANWFGAVPPNFSGQAVTARFTWNATVATAANIRVEVASAFVAPGATNVPTFNTVQLATSANGGNGVQNTVSFTLDMTGADPGDEWFIRFRRLGADALDTLDGQTINLIRMELSY